MNRKLLIILVYLLLSILISCANKSSLELKQGEVNQEEAQRIPDITGEYELIEGHYAFDVMSYMLVVAKDTPVTGDIILFRSHSEKTIPPIERRYKTIGSLEWKYDGTNFYMIQDSGTKYHNTAQLDKSKKSLILTRIFEGEEIGVGKYQLLPNGTLE